MLENELPTLYVCEFTPNNKVAFEALRTAIDCGKEFPVDLPYQIALIQGPVLDVIAILVLQPRAYEVREPLIAWFAEAGATLYTGEFRKATVVLDPKYTVVELITGGPRPLGRRHLLSAVPC